MYVKNYIYSLLKQNKMYSKVIKFIIYCVYIDQSFPPSKIWVNKPNATPEFSVADH